MLLLLLLSAGTIDGLGHLVRLQLLRRYGRYLVAIGYRSDHRFGGQPVVMRVARRLQPLIGGSADMSVIRHGRRCDDVQTGSMGSQMLSFGR